MAHIPQVETELDMIADILSLTELVYPTVTVSEEVQVHQESIWRGCPPLPKLFEPRPVPMSPPLLALVPLVYVTLHASNQTVQPQTFRMVPLPCHHPTSLLPPRFRTWPVTVYPPTMVPCLVQHFRRHSTRNFSWLAILDSPTTRSDG